MQQQQSVVQSGKGVRKQGSVSGSAAPLSGVSGGSAAASGLVQQQQMVHHSPSKVLHIRGLPPYTSEGDVVSFFSSLPGVSLTRILLLPNSNQAFLQVASIEQAQQLMHTQAAQGGHLSIKGKQHIRDLDT